MQVKVRAFGQIAEFTGTQLTVDATSTTALRGILEQQYPRLANMKYAIALNKKIVAGDAELAENDEIALMPPYSGG